MTALTWSPTIEFVRETIADEGKLRLIISPFIKLDALRELVEACEDVSQLQVVVRWRASDLAAGVSDVETYPYLKERGVALFRHTSIHLKLLVYTRSLSFHTSGNITRKGLGLAKNSNVEIGCPVTLDHEDWANLLGLLAESQRIDDQMYEQASKYVHDNSKPEKKLPPMNLTPSEEKDFSINSLPASENPERLYQYYAGNTTSGEQELDDSAGFVHDILVYSIPAGLSRDEFFETLAANFKSSPFIKSLVEHVRQKGSVHFGGVNSWIAEHCSDTPRPYRHDLKTATRRLYDWLSFFIEELSWDQPNVSMIIHWNE